MGRTALGTWKATTAASLTGTGVTLAAGETLLVGVTAYDAAITAVTWNGNAMTLDENSEQINTLGTVSIWRYRSAGGGTGSIVATPEGNTSMVMVAIKHDGIVASTPLDKTAQADAASGTGADSGNTATTAQADEFLFGIVGAVDVTTDTAPTWLNSFSGGQFDKNTDAGNKVLCAEGYRTVAATGAYKAAATLTNSREWAAAIATYKINTAQSSTPPSLEVPMTANAGTGVPGPVTSSPASHPVPMAANDATPLVGARVVVPESLAVPLVPAVTSEQGGQLEIEHGPRLPNVVTQQNFVVVRPTTPTDLGDGNATTYVSGTVVPPNPGGGTVEVVASAIADVPLPPGQVISHLRFRALCWVSEFHETDMGYSNFRMGWTVGGNSAEAAVTNEWPDIAPDTVIHRDADGVQAGDFVTPEYFVSTGNIATKPGGGAWTAADVNALTNVALRYDYAPGVGYAEMYVAEILIEVHGPVGMPPKEVRITQNMGRLVRHQRLDSSTGGE